jgi:hypothetical protein
VTVTLTCVNCLKRVMSASRPGAGASRASIVRSSV